MSSLFARPESPPPRVPSPPPRLYTPLASPCCRTRKPSSSSSAPSLPPGLQQQRALLTTRSYEHLSHKREPALHRFPKRTRSALSHSACSSRTNSLPEPLTQPILPNFSPRHRTLSMSPRTSPPPSPQMHTPPPPVPPIPSFVLTPAEKLSSHSPDSPPLAPIYLPDLDPRSPLSGFPAAIVKSKKSSLEKTRAAGVTCLKFFTLRNSLKSSRLSDDRLIMNWKKERGGVSLD